MKRIVWEFLVFVALSSMSLNAQSTFGEIRGTVVDPSGAVVAGASVTTRNTGTSDTRKVATDSDGNYSALNLDAGTYEVTIENSGFRTSVTQNVLVRAREIARVDSRLELQGTATEVLVTAARQVITTDQATIVDSKTIAQIQQIPVNFRAGSTNSVFSAVSFAPGVQPDSNDPPNLSLAGGMPFMLTASIDGISTINVRSNGVMTDTFPSADAIGEIKVSTISNNAEYAQVGDVTMTSRGGTNEFHGSAYWYHQNGAFDARDFFSPRQGAPFKVSNDFGFSVGGPVIKNKTFFFGDYEGLRFHAQSLINTTVPPDSYRAGNLSSVAGVIKDPLNGGAPFPGNIIPTNRINPVSAKVLEKLYPRQITPGDRISNTNYTVLKPRVNTNNQYDLRGDHNFTDKQTVFARYSYKNIVRATPLPLTTLGDDRAPEKSRTLVVSYNYVIRSTLLNEFRSGFTNRGRGRDFGIGGADFDGPGLVKELGIVGIRPDPPKVPSVPDFGFSGPFIGTGNARGFKQLSRNLQFTDNLTWSKGRHTFKFGADIRRIRTTDNISFFSGDDLGEYRFNGQYTGNDFADFLLGFPNRTRLANTSPDIDGSTSHQGYYAQDDFKVSPRLTMTYGVRYEFHPPFYDATLQIANFDRNFPGGRVIVPNAASVALTSPQFKTSIGSTPIITAADAGIPESLRYSDKNNFMPRIGFAYRPFGDRTVIRGGYGVFSVTILGAVFYSLTGIHTSDTRTFTNTPGTPQFTFPQPFGAGLGAISAVGNADFRRATDIHSPDPYVQQWNFTAERDLGWNTGLRATYTGSHTVKLFSSPDLNQVPVNNVGYQTAKLSRPFPNWAIVYSRDPNVSAKYHALNVELYKRFSNSLFFQTSYAWAKNLSNANGSNGTGFAAEAGSVPTDSFNPSLDYGNLSGTRRHRLLTTYSYSLPFAKEWMPSSLGGKVAKAAVAGWDLAGIVLFQTGQFLTPITGGSTDPSGTNVDSRANDRPDYTGTSYGNLPSDKRTLLNYWDRSAFVIPPSNIGRFGNVGPGQLIGPGTVVTSAKLQKKFYFAEKSYFQLEGSATNLMNHANFANPAASVGAVSFGRISATQTAEGAGARTLQVGLRIAF
jgi:hypothetical protein